MRYLDDDRALDGNVLAGDLSEIFTPEMTSAQATCAGCRATNALGDGVAYVGGPGVVLRCRVCRHVLARFVQAREALWFDLAGIAAIRVPARGYTHH